MRVKKSMTIMYRCPRCDCQLEFGEESIKSEEIEKQRKLRKPRNPNKEAQCPICQKTKKNLKIHMRLAHDPQYTKMVSERVEKMNEARRLFFI